MIVQSLIYKSFYFFDFGLTETEIGGGGVGIASLALPTNTDLLNRPFITGASHLIEESAVFRAFSVSTLAVVWLTDLKLNENISVFNELLLK